ncbi:hypothetical protein BCR44DRAFT_1278162 [Catenaria anguillulae PL171]|uniref:Uncharacterized protein n=1 Tax=Catenaria anguillulae PL171 TaxID=765915 RepID=A0A1Y2HDJ1_9FUNG|nr:hypothetical protein BCR44DRAFT_1278162 [Catenaria anguillulae PL171]
MNVTMLVFGRDSLAVPEFTNLFRFSALSNILLTCWAVFAHIETRFFPWAEWKMVYYTLVAVWCCVNSTLAYAYLVEQKARAEHRVRQLNVNGLGSTASALKSVSTGAETSSQGGGVGKANGTGPRPVKASASVGTVKREHSGMPLTHD